MFSEKEEGQRVLLNRGELTFSLFSIFGKKEKTSFLRYVIRNVNENGIIDEGSAVDQISDAPMKKKTNSENFRELRLWASGRQIWAGK